VGDHQFANVLLDRKSRQVRRHRSSDAPLVPQPLEGSGANRS
jgi:hypothetical protein